MSPALCVAGVAAYSLHGNATAALVFAALCLFFSVGSVWLLRGICSKLPIESIESEAIEHADQHTLEFMIAYLLPVFTTMGTDGIEKTLPITAVCLVILLLTIVQSDAFLYNPVLAFIGYRSYIVKPKDGLPYLFLAKKRYHGGVRKIDCKRLGEYIRIDVSKG